ncbi:hypothetical protein JCM15765_25130 [Paradesulfitobacterium aromaticivorans]
MGYRGRDVEVAMLTDGQCLVAACDSCGAIGEKEYDIVKVTPYLVGRLTVRVALLEVLAAGAVPQIVTVAVSNELNPTGDGILAGVKDELKFTEKGSLPVAVSTEKNMPTSQTGLGISIVGTCRREELRIATSQGGDNVYCLGLPKVGSEVQSPDDEEIVQGKHVLSLVKIKGIHDIVPIGSQGIRREADLLAENVGCDFIPDCSSQVDWKKSAGPSTCLIFTSPAELTASALGELAGVGSAFWSIALHKAGILVPNVKK